MRCDKCGGCIHSAYGEVKCLNCAKYFHEPVADPITNEAYRWQSVLCSKCDERTAIRGRELCRPCWDTRQERKAKR